MLAKRFDLEESKMYDGLNDESLEKWLSNPQELDLSLDPLQLAYHTNKKAYIPTEHVKIRLIYNRPLFVNFATQSTPTSILPVHKAIIHFHGGGFCSGDSASH